MSFLKTLKNKKFLASTVSLFILFVLILPILTFAQRSSSTTPDTGLVPCGNADQPACDFDLFVFMVNNIISWIISVAGVIFTISAVYGGFLYMTSGEKPANKEKAKDILWNTLIGFVIILVSWLIVYTILTNLTSDSVYKDSIFKFIGNGN